MFPRTIVTVVALGLLTSISAGARAAEPERCGLSGKFLARSATPYTVTENAGYTSYSEFRGAELFVPAQPGLTAEWLQRVLAFQIAAGECDFGVRDVSVSVLSAGSGFSVRLSGKDERAAREILRRAQQLVNGP